MNKKRLAVLFLSTLFSPLPVMGQVTINGFASAGGGMFLDELEEGQLVEGNYSDEFDASPFIKFAIQTKAKVNERTTITGQFIARGIDDYDVKAEWAYITYEMSSSTDIRLGRMRAPLFMYSDFIDVGYAYPWIRPPIELYRLPFSTVEGVDFINRHTMGNWDGMFQVFYGNLEEDGVLSDQETVIDLDGFAGVNYVLSNDWFSWRFAYNVTEFSVETPVEALPLFAGLEAASQGFAAVGTPATDVFASNLLQLADLLEIRDEDGVFYGTGFTVDTANWLMAGEFTILDVGDQSLVANDESWYLMVGRRFGDLTMHLTYQEQVSDPDLSVLDLVPNIGDPTLEALRAGAEAAIVIEDDSSWTLGFRYDYAASTAFKFEIAQVEAENDGVEGTTLSFSVDVVF